MAKHRNLFAKLALFLMTCLCLAGGSRAAEPPSAALEALRQSDVRLATVLYRLATANDELCLEHVGAAGLVLHDSSAYTGAVRDVAVRYFDFESAIGIEGAVPGSPAAKAGIRADDSLIAINGDAIPPDESREQAIESVEAAAATGPVRLAVRHGGHDRDVTLEPVRACRADAEVAVSDDLNAGTDGDVIQVDSALINLIGGDDQALAAIVAHELAHIVLDHPDRLTAAHVNRGLFKGFGRNARLIKQTENEADRLSVTLMANAGYDPRAAVRYWLTYGPHLNDHGGFGSTHLSWRERADLIRAEVDRVSRETVRPIVPAWINSRTQPLR